MTDLRTAAQQALEALEWHYRQGHSNTLGGLRLKIDEKTLRNLKAALAEPVQEPVADKMEEAHDWQYRITGERLRRIEKLEAQRDALLEALKYHQEQTRPIQKSIDAIAKAEEQK